MRTTSLMGHNCAINVLCAALFGRSTADEVRPFRTNTRIAWLFRLWLADQLPKTAKLGANLVNDWRRTLIMMYEGLLFRSEEFQNGTIGEGFNLSIMEFKKLKERRIHEWIHSVKM